MTQFYPSNVIDVRYMGELYRLTSDTLEVSETTPFYKQFLKWSDIINNIELWSTDTKNKGETTSMRMKGGKKILITNSSEPAYLLNYNTNEVVHDVKITTIMSMIASGHITPVNHRGGGKNKEVCTSTGKKVTLTKDGKKITRVVHENQRGTKVVKYNNEWVLLSKLKM